MVDHPPREENRSGIRDSPNVQGSAKLLKAKSWTLALNGATAGYQSRCERGCFLRIMCSLAWLDSAFVDRIDGIQRVFGCNGNVDMSTLFELHFVAVFVS